MSNTWVLWEDELILGGSWVCCSLALRPPELQGYALSHSFL